MRFNTKELNPGVWFYFDEDAPEEGGVCLRRVTSDKMAEIHKKTRSVKIEFRRGRRYEVVERDEKKEDLLLWDYCIADWQTVEDDDGNPIEATAENKALLMGGSPAFAGFVADCLEKLDKDFAEREEEATKN